MKFTEFDLEVPNGMRRPSPGICIYCFSPASVLTDEHVIPFALAANTFILEKSCCRSCQQIIQPYEQEVLKKQLGNFRAQIDSPTRNRRDRQSTVQYYFSEFDLNGGIIRDIGSCTLPLDCAPIAVCLWSSPQPQYGLPPDQLANNIGAPWSYCEKDALKLLCRKVASEYGAPNVGVKLGEVNREHYLRFLAKVAHSYAATELGLDGFDPFLLDIILKRSNDLNLYIGDDLMESPSDDNPVHIFQISLGRPKVGPLVGLLVVRIQLYPMLKSPSHLIVVGRITPTTLE
jgi:hypothetical protein